MIIPSIYPYLRTRNKDSQSLVYILCYFKNTKKQFVRISTGLKIHAHDWVEETKSPTVEFVLNNQDWYSKFIKSLKLVELAFQNAYKTSGEDVSAKDVTEIYENNSRNEIAIKDKTPIKTLSSFIRWYIKKQENTPFDKQKSEATIKQYVNIFNRLEDYTKATKRKIYLATVSMDDVDMNVSWFERQKHSNGRSYAQNTIQDHEKWLIALINKAVANRFDCPLWNPKQSEGRVTIGKTDDIHFTVEDLKKIMDYTPKNQLERSALVWAVIGYCTGLRHSDWKRCYELLSRGKTEAGEELSTITVSGKEYRFLHMRPHKTRRQNNGQGIWCGIPVLTPIENIIAKHGLPRPAVDQVMNRSLKEVALQAGIDEQYTKKTAIARGKTRLEEGRKGEFATTHKIGRVSFITQFAEYIPKPILVKITAHTSGRKDAFDGYIKDLNLKRNAERFIEMLQDHQSRGEFGDVQFV